MNFLKSRPRLNYWLLFTAKTLFLFWHIACIDLFVSLQEYPRW